MNNIGVIKWIEEISDEYQAALVAFLLPLPSLTNVGFHTMTCAGGSHFTHALALMKEGVPTLELRRLHVVCISNEGLLSLPDGHPILMLSAHLPAFDPLALSPAL